MYVAGLGDSGQLGLGMERRQKAAQVFTLIPFQYQDYNVVNITAGVAHNSRSNSSRCQQQISQYICSYTMDIKSIQQFHVYTCTYMYIHVHVCTYTAQQYVQNCCGMASDTAVLSRITAMISRCIAHKTVVQNSVGYQPAATLSSNCHSLLAYSTLTDYQPVATLFSNCHSLPACSTLTDRLLSLSIHTPHSTADRVWEDLHLWPGLCRTAWPRRNQEPPSGTHTHTHTHTHAHTHTTYINIV